MGNRFKDLEALFDMSRTEKRHGSPDEEREKLSWRELDKRREGSKHSDQGRESTDRKKAPLTCENAGQPPVAPIRPGSFPS